MISRKSSLSSARRGEPVVACIHQFTSQFFQKHKMLRILQAGRSNPPHLTRINEHSSLSASAVQGDVLIHRPNLVAGLVVSERRNHHLHQVIIQTNQ